MAPCACVEPAFVASAINAARSRSSCWLAKRGYYSGRTVTRYFTGMTAEPLAAPSPAAQPASSSSSVAASLSSLSSPLGGAKSSCGAACVDEMSRASTVLLSEREHGGESGSGDGGGHFIPLRVLDSEDYNSWLAEQPSATRVWMQNAAFQPNRAGDVAVVPRFLQRPADGDGGGDDEDAASVFDQVLLSLGDRQNAQHTALQPWTYAALPTKLPRRVRVPFRLCGQYDADAAAIGFALGAYRFGGYRTRASEEHDEAQRSSEAAAASPPLALAASARAAAAAEATYLVRDLINLSAEDLCPQQLEAAVRALAGRFDGASARSVVGDALLEHNFPMIHAVGRASCEREAFQPRLLELNWSGTAQGGADGGALPRVTLVGKGVCYDTGGLDLKPAASMRNMKKDMGGAAQVLGLAAMIMRVRLPVQLRVLIPAVENAVSPASYRPGDVLRSRSGVSTEIDNTDAEGRLVLADALSYACERDDERPALLVDCATLTGAQRVALGTEMPGIFCTQEEVARDLQRLGKRVGDVVWELPLHLPYRRMLDSSIADLKNASSGGFAGAITAALYLKEFVPDGVNWVHMDFMGYNVSTQPGRPEGGEAQGMRALFELISEKYAGE